MKRLCKQVYKITYPTKKIYIGKDSYGSCRYMGSPNPDIVNEDFANLSVQERSNYVIRKEILWQSDTATEAELAKKEMELIRQHKSNDPRIGYNRSPKFQGGDEVTEIAEEIKLDIDLRRVVEAWPHLPDAMKAGVLAMVAAVSES